MVVERFLVMTVYHGAIHFSVPRIIISDSNAYTQPNLNLCIFLRNKYYSFHLFYNFIVHFFLSGHCKIFFGFY